LIKVLTKMANRFIEKNKTELIEKVSMCLSGEISPWVAREYAEDLMDEWGEFVQNNIIEEHYAKGEKVFWAIIWLLEISVEGDSWEDNIPPESLAMYLDLLKKGDDLPNGHDARRP